jgi:hypothetical protein
MEKVAIIVHATESELGRALHALLYAQELHEAGIDVKVFFDGAGTVWVKTLENPDNDYNSLYKATKNLGVIAGVCEYCAGAFGVNEDVQASSLPVTGEHEGHFSVVKLIKDGYQIITL